jgi:hypothetical protein
MAVLYNDDKLAYNIEIKDHGIIITTIHSLHRFTYEGIKLSEISDDNKRKMDDVLFLCDEIKLCGEAFSDKKCFKNSVKFWKKAIFSFKTLLKNSRVMLFGGHPSAVTESLLNMCGDEVKSECILFKNNFPKNKNLRIKVFKIQSWEESMKLITDDLKNNLNIFVGVGSRKLAHEFENIWSNVLDKFLTGESLWVHGFSASDKKNPDNGIEDLWKLYQVIIFIHF